MVRARSRALPRATAPHPTLRSARSSSACAVQRYARFFITTVTGLVAGLLAPFAAFARTPTLAAIGSTLFVGLLLFLYLTLDAMKGGSAPPSYVPPPSRGGGPNGAVSRPAPQVDPQMRKMLEDIYGE